MPFKRSSMRFAHTNGFTCCCYTENAERIITAGADGDIRIWSGIDDDDPTSQCVGEFVLGIAHYDERIIATTDLNTVQAYTFPNFDRDGTDFRFTAPVICVRVNKKFIAAGSEDTNIKVAPIGKPEEVFELTGHEGPVLKIDLSADGQRLVSSSGDGTIRIWCLTERKLLKVLTGFDKVTSIFAAKKFISPSFEPTKAKTIAYAMKNEIIIIDANSYEIQSKLKDDKVSSDFSVCCYSPCGKYIAAGSESGEISIWNAKTGDKIKGDTKGDDCQTITSIEWNPINNGELAYTEMSGQLGIVDQCYDLAEHNVDELIDDQAIDNDHDDDVDFGDVEFTNDDEDADNDNCISLEKLKNESMRNIQQRDEIDDLLDAKSVHSEIRRPMTPVVKVVPLQPPFQSSATPLSLEHRYMLWNSIGIVRAHKTDNENSIEVEFHDASVHHGIHITNYLNHTMASLSTSVLALSCETPSKLVCIALGAGSREWSISLPNCEEILSVAASEKLVAIATDARYLRLFSIMGTQREVLSFSGPVITVAGHSDSILVAYHNSSADDDQHVKLLFVQAIGLSLRCRELSLPLSPMSKLRWLGYSDRGSPVFCDSTGMVRMMNLKSNFWMPVCDTNEHKKNESDNFFVIDVSEVNQIVRAILCRGTSYPLTNPKPMVMELPMQVPMCDLDTEKTQLEESLLRCVNFQMDAAEKNMKEIAIKLFALACRSEMETRAKELIEMIASPALLPLAIKYASKLGRIHLSEKLGELLPQFEQIEREKEKNQNDIEIEVINLLQNSPMGATMLLGQREKQPTTPLIVPKPMIISQLKRNPFKRSSIGTPKSSTPNPLSHLTDKAVGYSDTQESMFDSHSVIEDSQTIQLNENIENEASNSNTQQSAPEENNEKPVPTFVDWYKLNKPDLLTDYPNIPASELTKVAMRKYKIVVADIKSGDCPSSSSSNKRKTMDDEDNTAEGSSSSSKEQSGIAKLAKFGFSKAA